MALRKDYNQAEQSAVLKKNADKSWAAAKAKKDNARRIQEYYEKEAIKKGAKPSRERAAEAKKSKSSFGTAFADARKAGKETFTWNGKSYNTKRADDKPASKPQRAKGSEGYKPTDTKKGPNMSQVNKPDAKPAPKKDNRSTMQKLFGASEERRQMGRDLQKKAQKSMGFKKGGAVKHRGDGCCMKGHTKGKMV